MVWLSDGVTFEDIFIGFGATHERDRRTDGQTDRHRMPAIAALKLCIASHGKSDALSIGHAADCLFMHTANMCLGSCRHNSVI